MSNNKKTKNNRVQIGIILSVIGFIIGGSIGTMQRSFHNAGIDFSLNPLNENLNLIVCIASGAIALIFGIGGSIAGIVLYRQAKNLTKKSSSNETILDKAEQKVDLLSAVASISAVISIVALIVMFLAAKQLDIRESNLLLYAIFTLIIIVSYIILMILNQKAYKLNKELNPNLDFNIFDMRIMDTAENQTDEAQRLLLYKAAYKSMAICINTILFVTVIAFLISAIFGFSFVPTLILGIVTVFMQTVFSIEQYRVNHPKTNKKKYE